MYRITSVGTDGKAVTCSYDEAEITDLDLINLARSDRIESVTVEVIQR